MPKSLFLFPDTNLFYQCKPLDSLDWSLFGTFDEIKLYVTRPVQAEIDGHKGKGTGRLANRARSTSSTFRDLLLSVEDFKVVLGSPRVLLFLRHDLKKDESLLDQLDYSCNDDQLVGIAAAYARANPDEDVRILTHDTGPMASARLVGLTFEVIPDKWLLAPESDETEKTLNKVKNELALYKKAEPSVSLQIQGGQWDQGKNSVSLAISRYRPLTTEEVEELMMIIRKKFPMAKDYGSTTREERSVPNQIFFTESTIEIFEPASQESIKKYCAEDYPDWLLSCEEALRNLHSKMGVTWPSISILLSNTGSRPASDALLRFSVNGELLISTRPEKKDKKEECPLKLPPAPQPPVGRWSKPVAVRDAFCASITRNYAESIVRPIHSPFNSSLGPGRRDPNVFYFKSSQHGFPCKFIQLECEQWRHQKEADQFELFFYISPEPGNYNDALQVDIHGSNMTEPFKYTVPIRILVEEISFFDLAVETIQNISFDKKIRLFGKRSS